MKCIQRHESYVKVVQPTELRACRCRTVDYRAPANHVNARHSRSAAPVPYRPDVEVPAAFLPDAAGALVQVERPGPIRLEGAGGRRPVAIPDMTEPGIPGPCTRHPAPCRGRKSRAPLRPGNGFDGCPGNALESPLAHCCRQLCRSLRRDPTNHRSPPKITTRPASDA